MSGRPAIGRSSLGTTFVAGKDRIPNPAAGITAFLICIVDMTLRQRSNPCLAETVILALHFPRPMHLGDVARGYAAPARWIPLPALLPTDLSLQSLVAILEDV